MPQEKDGNGSPLEGFASMERFLSMLAAWVGAPVMALSTKLGSMGTSYQGLPMFMGIIGMFLIIGLAGGPFGLMHASVAVAFMAIVLLAHRIKRFFLCAKGYRCSSNYDGEPSCGGDEMTAKQWKIPVLGIFVGVGLVLFISVGVGVWLIVASVCQSATVSSYRHRLSRQVQAMRDAMISQQVVRDQYEREENS